MSQFWLCIFALNVVGVVLNATSVASFDSWIGALGMCLGAFALLVAVERLTAEAWSR